MKLLDAVVLLMSETFWTSVEYKSQIIEQRIWPFRVSSEIEMCLGCCSLLEAEVMLALYGNEESYYYWLSLPDKKCPDCAILCFIKQINFFGIGAFGA